MNLRPPIDWTDVATKRDLAELGAATSADIATSVAELKADLLRTFGTRLSAGQAGVIAAVAVVVAFVG